jgi:hypothetical protein
MGNIARWKISWQATGLPGRQFPAGPALPGEFCITGIDLNRLARSGSRINHRKTGSIISRETGNKQGLNQRNKIRECRAG